MKTIKLLPKMLEPYKDCIIQSGIMVINNTAVIFNLKDDVFYLDLIVTDPDCRGNGEGKFVMEHICNQADLTNTTIELIPDSTFNTDGFIEIRSWRNIFYKQAMKRKNKLTTKQLIEWYKRLGFEKTETKKMIRKPNQKN
jgi:N-acetylglutamate synthase-like GNAT family acetyltransferase